MTPANETRNYAYAYTALRQGAYGPSVADGLFLTDEPIRNWKRYQDVKREIGIELGYESFALTSLQLIAWPGMVPAESKD